MKPDKLLQDLGYSPSEVKIYLAALEVEEATITEIAERVNLPRTSVQAAVHAMHRQGLMDYYVKKKRKLWTASDPDKFMAKLKERETALKELLPVLKAKRHLSGEKPLVKFFFGIDGIKAILDDIIDSRHHIQGIVAWEDWKAFLGSEYAADFIERRYRNFLKMRLLVPKTASSIEQLKRKDGNLNRTTKFIPQHFAIHTSNFIYGHKVALISFNRVQAVGILIEEADIAATMTCLFESLWHQSTDH